MKTFPIKQAVAIVVLLITIICTITLLPDKAGKRTTGGESNIGKRSTAKAIEASPVFRFSSTPKSITLSDLDDKILYKKTSFDEQNEHLEFDSIIIPHDQKKVSHLKLSVEWGEEPKPFHFFTMEFDGFSQAKYGTSVTADIFDEIQLQW